MEVDARFLAGSQSQNFYPVESSAGGLPSLTAFHRAGLKSKILVTDMCIDCHKCIYYYVTWNPVFPHGCHGMGFISKRYPNTEVRGIMNGKNCLLFIANKKKKFHSAEKIGN